jgi:hypothetical protein
VRRLNAEGVAWTAETLASVEAGETAVSMGDLLILCLVYAVGLPELFVTDAEEVELSSTVRMNPKNISLLVSGASWPDGFWYSRVRLDIDIEVIKRLAPGQYEDDVDRVAFHAKVVAYGQPREREMAARLDVDPQYIVAASFGLWGHSLNDERSRRLGEALQSEATIDTDLASELSERIREARGE